MDRKTFPEILSQLLEGCTILKVEQGSNGGSAKISCQNGSITRTFEISSLLSPERSGMLVRNLRETSGTSGEFVCPDADMMMNDIIEHVEAIGGTITPEEDALKARFGFRDSRLGTTWWTTLAAIRKSKFAAYFQTPEGRNALAACLTNEGIGLRKLAEASQG